MSHLAEKHKSFTDFIHFSPEINQELIILKSGLPIYHAETESFYGSIYFNTILKSDKLTRYLNFLELYCLF